MLSSDPYGPGLARGCVRKSLGGGVGGIVLPLEYMDGVGADGATYSRPNVVVPLETQLD